MSATETSELDWPTLVFDQHFLTTVDRLANRRFGEGGLAEEASTHVVDYLSANDWEKCAAYQGRAKPTTFLYTLVNNAIEEFSRKRFGRPRPPVWLQDLGESWVKLWRSLCLERQLLPALRDRLTRNDFREASEVEQAAKVIKARIPNCGQVSMDSKTVDDIDQMSDMHQADQYQSGQCEEDTDAFEALSNPFHTELLTMVSAIVSDNVSPDTFEQDSLAKTDELAGSLIDRFDKMKASLSLSDQERIMLRMIYVEGLSKTATSKALGLAPHQAGRMVNDALERIGEALKACDIDLESILSQL